MPGPVRGISAGEWETATGGSQFGLTEARDLRHGTVPWRVADWAIRERSAFPHKRIDVAIVGAGITGAIVADRLVEAGRSVALLDRRPPGLGSTAASTAQIMWAMDVPMVELAEELGEAEAARRWLRVYHAVRRFGSRLDRLEPGLRQNRPVLYLAGDRLDSHGLEREAAMRRRAGLPSEFQSPDAVGKKCGVAPRAGIASQGSFAIDPVNVCRALLDNVVERGGAVIHPVDVRALHPRANGMEVETADGRSLVAGDVILATGYERPSLFLPPSFSLVSTFAIATPPRNAPLWRDNAMIWEASDPYLYVRKGKDGRIIAGGEDSEVVASKQRNALMPEKAATIASKLQALLGRKPLEVDRAWCATFGTSPDGLPAIGRSSLMEHVWLAAGYGGNGIAFAALAGEMLARALTDEPDPDAICFDPYRFGTSAQR